MVRKIRRTVWNPASVKDFLVDDESAWANLKDANPLGNANFVFPKLNLLVEMPLVISLSLAMPFSSGDSVPSAGEDGVPLRISYLTLNFITTRAANGAGNTAKSISIYRGYENKAT